MNENNLFKRLKTIFTGLAFIIFPLIFIFTFAVHPGLLQPHLLGPEELIMRAHHADLLQFGHVLITLSTVLLIVVALQFMRSLEQTKQVWAGLIGAILAILGAIFLAVDKGALCMTMSAFDTLSEEQFTRIMPGILVLFNKEGWLVLVWGILLLPIGFAIQGIALLKTKILPPWQGCLFLIGIFLVGTPDGLEIINLLASILIALALIPYGLYIIDQRQSPGAETNVSCL